MGYLSNQRWVLAKYEFGEFELEDADEQESFNKEILRAFKMEHIAVTAELYRQELENTPISWQECEMLKKKNRKSNKEKMRINLFQIQKVLPELDLMKLKDEKLLDLVSNWSAFLFDHEFRISQTEDPIKYCKEEFHKIARRSNQVLWTKVARKRESKDSSRTWQSFSNLLG